MYEITSNESLSNMTNDMTRNSKKKPPLTDCPDFLLITVNHPTTSKPASKKARQIRQTCKFGNPPITANNDMLRKQPLESIISIESVSLSVVRFNLQISNIVKGVTWPKFRP